MSLSNVSAAPPKSIPKPINRETAVELDSLKLL
jgi:hypothetical protein